MRDFLFLLTVPSCAGCVTHSKGSIYSAFDIGMSANQVRKVFDERGGQIYRDDGDVSHGMIVGYINSSGLTPFAWISFENRKIKRIWLAYYHRSDMARPNWSSATCDANFHSILAELEQTYGSPNSYASTSDFQRMVDVRWTTPFRFIQATESADENYCADISVHVFDGSEADYSRAMR